MESTNNLKKISLDISNILHHYNLNYDDLRRLFKYIRNDLNIKANYKTKRLPEYLTFEEVQLLINSTYENNFKHGLIIKVLFNTGCRVSELINIKKSDIVFSQNKIKIRMGKGYKERYVLIGNNLKNELLTYLKGDKEGFLFESNRNNKFTDRRIRQILSIEGNKAKIEKNVYPHLLRHSLATHLNNKGMPIESIKVLLGHQNINTTQIYAKMSLNSVSKQYNQVIA
jgi:integrase/recombinase XerD